MIKIEEVKKGHYLYNNKVPEPQLVVKHEKKILSIFSGFDANRQASDVLKKYDEEMIE